MTPPATVAPFWTPATERAQLWRTMLGLLIAIAFFFAFTLLMIGGYWAFYDDHSSPMFTVAVFLTFIGGHLGVLVALRLLHARGYASLLGASGRINWDHVHVGFLVVALMVVVMSMIQWTEPYLLPRSIQAEIEVRPLLPWLSWLPVAFVLICIQASAEEFFFRGYLLQQLRARSRSYLVYALLPSLLFGLGHYDAATFGTLNASLYLVLTTVLGLMATHITLYTGNLSAAISAHITMNLSTTFAGVKGVGDGFSLIVPDVPGDSGYMTYLLLLELVVICVAYLLWRRWVARAAKG